MKKILAVGAMAAMLAGAAFAMDFSATAKVSGSLASNRNGTFNLLEGFYSESGWDGVASVSTEKAGGTFSINNGWMNNLWVKPVDMLTLSLNPNTLGVSVSLSPVTIDVGLPFGAWGSAGLPKAWDYKVPTSAWLEGTTIYPGSSVKLSLADIGFGSAYVKVADRPSYDEDGDYNPETMYECVVDAGYSVTVADIALGLNASVFFDNGFNKVSGDVSASTKIDTVSLSAKVPVEFVAADEEVTVGTEASVSLPVADMTFTLKAATGNWLALDSGNASVSGTLAGSLGAAGWTCGVSVNNKKGACNVSVPFSVTLAL